MTVSSQAQEIVNLVNSESLSQEDLHAINQAVVAKNKAQQRAKTKAFSKGQRVRITSNGVVGTIEKVNPKTIIVANEESSLDKWKVTPGLLELLGA